MSGIKLLNLDELAAAERAVNLGGKEYPVAEQTIGQMINRLQMSKRSDKDYDDPEVFLHDMRQTAQDILPTAPESVINTLSIRQITALIEFLNDAELDKTAEEMKAQAATEAGEPEKKS